MSVEVTYLVWISSFKKVWWKNVLLITTGFFTINGEPWTIKVVFPFVSSARNDWIIFLWLQMHLYRIFYVKIIIKVPFFYFFITILWYFVFWIYSFLAINQKLNRGWLWLMSKNRGKVLFIHLVINKDSVTLSPVLWHPPTTQQLCIFRATVWNFTDFL